MERIGRYQVERELGRGTMSIVYKAFDQRIDRYLAVKVLREQFARDVTSRQRFLREARAAGGLGHHSIVTVFDVGQIDGVPYLAMELLDGETLADRLNAGYQPNVREILELAIQLTSALAYAHQRGVIHRDIKPANIHFDPETGVAKLLDFGIAGIKTRQDRELAAGQVVVGTPAYMAPEQMSGDAQDERCDLYALGVLLYRLLAGKLPFDHDKLGELMAAVVGEPPPALEPLHSDTPVELVEMTHRLLVKQPSGRYASAVEVLEELQDIRSGLNRGLLASARRKSQAWRWPLAVGAVVAVVLVLGLSHVYRSQNEAMAATTFGYGEGLASVIAREVAEPMLLDDGAALNNLVSDFSGNPKVLYLHIVDRSGRIQSSTHLFLQDEPVPALEDGILRREEAAIRVLQSRQGDLEFQVPIRFQARRLGEVYLGVDGSALHGAARSTLSMMVMVFLAAMAVILVGLVAMVRHQRRLIERLAWGLRRIGKGHYEFRLDGDRRDEFGLIYRRFNDMAMRLEERYGVREAVELSPLLPDVADDHSGLESTTEIVPKSEPGESAQSDDSDDNGEKKVARFPGRRK
jgi:eukaryotic-like serine/threonine-protein kinase